MSEWLSGFLFSAMLLVPIFCWFVHLYTCFTEQLWGFLIAGAVLFPIGIVHGFGIIIGIW